MIYDNFIQSDKISYLTRIGSEEDSNTKIVFKVTFEKDVSTLESKSLTLLVYENNSEIIVIHTSSEDSKGGVSLVEKSHFPQLINDIIKIRKDYDKAEVRGDELSFENIKDADQSENPWEVLGL